MDWKALRRDAGLFFRFFGRWLHKGFMHAWGVADVLSSFLGLLIPLLLWMNRQSDQQTIPDQNPMNELMWQIPLAVLALLFTCRFVLAPFWMHQEDQTTHDKAVAEMLTVHNKAMSEKEAALDQARAEVQSLRVAGKPHWVRDKLAAFLAAGTALHGEKIISQQFDDWKHQVEVWTNQVEAFLRKHRSAADAIIFRDASWFKDTVQPRWAVSNDHREVLYDLEKRLDNLRKLL